jgi:hypothetical protein
MERIDPPQMSDSKISFWSLLIWMICFLIWSFQILYRQSSESDSIVSALPEAEGVSLIHARPSTRAFEKVSP